MEEIPTPGSYNHEEASVSLKVVLLLFAVVLVGALAYLVMTERQSTDGDSGSSVIYRKKTPTVTATTSTTATATATTTATATATKTATASVSPTATKTMTVTP